MRRMSVAILALVMLALVFIVAYAEAQTPYSTYLPSILHNSSSAEQPTPQPTPTGGVVVVTDLTLPFNVLGGVDPAAIQDSTGMWYISVFRIDSGSNNGMWIVSWREGDTTATPIGLAAPAQPALFDTQDVPISNSRGVVAHNHNSTAGYVFAWLDREGGSRRPKLRIARIVNYR